MKTDLILKENERIDDLQIRGLKIIQNPDLFCFGIDAVLLSYYASARKGDRVMDLCTGNGAIPILMSSLSPSLFDIIPEISLPSISPPNISDPKDAISPSERPSLTPAK